MGNKSKVKIVISILVIIFALIGLGIIIYKQEMENMRYNIRAVVVKVYDDRMFVIGEENIGFNSVYFAKEGDIGFKKGQEVLIYYGGYIAQTFPGQIGEAGKIEILKEQSDIEIPEYALKYCYSSKDNVSFEINKFTKKGLEFAITDTNEFPYTYNDNLEIYKRNAENELHNKENIGELSISSSKNPLIVEGRYDWSKVYGELTEGEYEIRMRSELNIIIKFTINANGEVTYSEHILTFF